MNNDIKTKLNNEFVESEIFDDGSLLQNMVKKKLRGELFDFKTEKDVYNKCIAIAFFVYCAINNLEIRFYIIAKNSFSNKNIIYPSSFLWSRSNGFDEDSEIYKMIVGTDKGSFDCNKLYYHSKLGISNIDKISKDEFDKFIYLIDIVKWISINSKKIFKSEKYEDVCKRVSEKSPEVLTLHFELLSSNNDNINSSGSDEGGYLCKKTKVNALEQLNKYSIYTQVYHINKSFSLFCLREYDLLNKLNLFGFCQHRLGIDSFIFKNPDLKKIDFETIKGLAWFKMAIEFSQVTFSKPFKDINIDSCYTKINLDSDNKLTNTKLVLEDSFKIVENVFKKCEIRLFKYTCFNPSLNYDGFSSFDFWDGFYDWFTNNQALSKLEVFVIGLRTAGHELKLNRILVRNRGECNTILNGMYKEVRPEELTLKEKEYLNINSYDDINKKYYNKSFCRINFEDERLRKRGITNDYNTETGLYEDKNMDLKWFGNAPFCDGDFCDAVMEGYVPLGLDKYGNGKKCLTGNKVLGIKYDNMIKEDLDFLDKSNKDECLKFVNSKDLNKGKIISDIFDTALNITKSAII